jgi:hypothetical protein
MCTERHADETPWIRPDGNEKTQDRKRTPRAVHDRFFGTYLVTELVKHSEGLHKDSCATDACRAVYQSVGSSCILSGVHALYLFQQVQELVGGFGDTLQR